MNEITQNIVGRRSIRKYKPEQIPDEILDEILLAGTYAPCAGGRQSPVFAVCQNAEVNRALGRVNCAAFREATGGKPFAKAVSTEQPSIGDDLSKTDGFYGAPTVVTIFAPKGVRNYFADCCVAAQNMLLAAHALGVGSCIIARAEATFAGERERALQAEWGIGEDYEAQIHVLLGYPDGPCPHAKPRRDGRIIRVK